MRIGLGFVFRLALAWGMVKGLFGSALGWLNQGLSSKCLKAVESPKDGRTKGPGDQGTRGPRDQGTKGEDWRRGRVSKD